MDPRPPPKHSFSLVGIGCSAGGIESLKKILPALPETLPVALVIIQHRGTDSPQILPQFFSQICRLPVVEPDDKDKIEKGVVYLAPTNYHLMVSGDRCFSLSVDDPVNHSRPSIDVFLETAAATYGEEMIGVVLSGANADGAAGLRTVKQYGGLAMAQDPATAPHPLMPLEAIRAAQPPLILSVEKIRDYLCEL